MAASADDTLELTRPDDWHLHLRDGEVMRRVLPDTAARFARAIIMPNLKPPVVTTEDARAYRDRILEALPDGAVFEPLMTLYLTERTRPEEIARARESGLVHGVKLYPAGATTNAEAGVRDIRAVHPVLEAMVEVGMPLLIHGEVTDPLVDVYDRERVFIERVLEPTLERFPDLRVVLEHVTTEDGVRFVERAPETVGATITAHHLLLNRNALFEGGLRPHHYCLPVLKRERHREALVAAATGGSSRFFLGTDSAPHPRDGKESSCGCAGIYTAHAALELYAEVFDGVGALERLEGFASWHGPAFYGLPANRERITLRRVAAPVPARIDLGGADLVPLRAGGQVAWSLAEGGRPSTGA